METNSTVKSGDDPVRELVPRLGKKAYQHQGLARRRAWLQERTGVRLEHVGLSSIDPGSMRGNIENPIGAAQIPIGVAGPLMVRGEQARGTFYVPMATTEGALIRSYERGMVTLTRAGGVEAVVTASQNQISPSFFFSSAVQAAAFGNWLQQNLDSIRQQAEETTRHGKLLQLECRVYGRQAIVNFGFDTGDAQGMNMIVKATDHACRWIAEHYPVESLHLFSGMCSEKRASGFVLSRGKGKWATANALLPDSLVRAYLGCSAQQLYEVWHATVVGHLAAHAVGYSGQLANGLAAIFIATGQDVANVANASAGLTDFHLTQGGIRVSVTLPALEIATVGGGTGLATQKECLQLLDCLGSGKSTKLAEIIAAALLGGEISMGAAIASGEFATAHERYGRNRPEEEESKV